MHNVYPRRNKPEVGAGDAPSTYDIQWYWNLKDGSIPQDGAILPVPYLQLLGTDRVTDIQEIKLSDYQVVRKDLLVSSVTVRIFILDADFFVLHVDKTYQLR